jgi:hypothetical protein
MLQIEQGIPMPQEMPRRGKAALYPWHDMQSGDSFFVPGGTRKRFSGDCRRMTYKLPPKEFACRDVEGGVRIWRVK